MSSYANPADLVAFGLNSSALSDITSDAQQVALDARSDFVDGYLSARFTLPLRTAGVAVKIAVCQLAAFDLMVSRGFGISDESTKQISKRYDDSLKWLQDVADLTVTPAGIVDSGGGSGSGDTSGTGPFARQVSVQYGSSSVASTMGINSIGPPTVVEQQGGGRVVVQQPQLRGWR